MESARKVVMSEFGGALMAPRQQTGIVQGSKGTRAVHLGKTKKHRSDWFNVWI